jgi:hypothetical protein
VRRLVGASSRGIMGSRRNAFTVFGW